MSIGFYRVLGMVFRDSSNPVFQEEFLSLEKEEAVRIIAEFRKIKQLSWPEIYKDKGLRWELSSKVLSPAKSR